MKKQNKYFSFGWFHRKKKTNRWHYRVNDVYTLRAKKEGYRARSIYKLMEIQERFWLIHPDFLVMDVWSAPGSFLQFLGSIIKQKPIIWIDLKSIDTFWNKNIFCFQWDILDYKTILPRIKEVVWTQEFDLITSDIAPNTTGRFDIDQYASVELNIAICQLSDIFLKRGWNMLLKVFKWEDFSDLAYVIKKRFMSMKTYKPLACRDSSHEEYILCFEKK